MPDFEDRDRPLPPSAGGYSYEDERHFLFYLRAFQRSGWRPADIEWLFQQITPKEMQHLFDAAGSPEEAERLIRSLRERSVDWEWAKTSRKKFSAAAKWLAITAGAVAIMRPIVQRLLELFPR